MRDVSVHTIPGSPFGRAVLATLEEKGASYRMAVPAPGGLKADPHVARHPFGRIPVLEDDGFLLYETQAILRYLDRVMPEPALTPADARQAARMDQVMGINDWYLFQGVCNVIAFQRVVGPRLMGLVPDEAAIAAAMPRAHVVVDELARLLGGQSFFAGAALSLADLAVFPQLEFLSMAPEWAVLVGPHPNLAAWLARMAARPSMQATTWERLAERVKAEAGVG